jgi:riboflavin-specific deaminase-like protein
MRSICDAVIIGNNTLKADEPKLTVRNVEGPSPVKVVIGNTKSSLDSLLLNNEGDIISFSTRTLYSDVAGVKEIIVEGDRISADAILDHLFAHGFHSVFVEGGAQTVSYFLKESKIDILQIHIANKILGSGKSAIDLDAIETVDECLTLKNTKYYRLGSELLLTARI